MHKSREKFGSIFIEKSLQLKYSCSAESKSDARLFCEGKQREAKPERRCCYYISHQFNCIKAL